MTAYTRQDLFLKMQITFSRFRYKNLEKLYVTPSNVWLQIRRPLFLKVFKNSLKKITIKI